MPLRRFLPPLSFALVFFVGCAHEKSGRAPNVGGERRPHSEESAAPAPHYDTALWMDSAQLSRRYDAAPALARFQGDVSYYSDSLAGHPTASGEPYEPAEFTAAHRSLPFGSVVRVTADNGRSVYVRINDRGPFVRGRVLDVSGAAARALGLIQRGVGRARAEVVEKGPPPRRTVRRLSRR